MPNKVVEWVVMSLALAGVGIVLIGFSLAVARRMWKEAGEDKKGEENGNTSRGIGSKGGSI